jgi:hypothetical protein
MMATIAQNRGGGLQGALVATARALLLVYRHGGESFRRAPALVALAVVPQFAQHAWEIEAGMFASVDAFRALQMDPTRWIFGYAKVAGLLAGIVLIARFWAKGSVRRAILVPPSDLLRVGLVFGATVAVDLLCKRLGEHIPMLDFTATAANMVLQFGLTFLLVAALLGDRETSLREALLQRWVATLFLVALAAAAFGPASVLHKATHTLAFGAPEAMVWAVMAVDSLIVGLLAALVGAALQIGHAIAPGLGGWRRDPRDMA